MKFSLSTRVMKQKTDSKILLNGIFLMLIFETRGKPFESSDESKESISQVKAAPVCRNTTYCEITPHYPTEVVFNALQKNPHLRNYENIDEMDVHERDEDIPEEEPLCVSTEQVVFPKSAETKSFEWQYIVNQEDFRQSVRIEKCREEGQQCRVIDDFAEGYYTKCKQKYIYRQLLAVSANGSIYHESFRFPASCCCHIEFRADVFLKSFKRKV
ncbi:protein spaetzle-like isoform X2 [Osmia bicornis bicornis]|nr:protein spaetzle-like isoform X2 [Osmia bicornis bicornis]